MIKFKWKITGTTAEGKKVTIYKYASNQKEVKKSLKELSLKNVKITKDMTDIVLEINEKLSSNETLEFLENLYDMKKLGISEKEIIEFNIKTASNKKLKNFYEMIYKNIIAGFNFSTSLENTGMLEEQVVLIIRTAESTGNMLGALEELIDYYKDKTTIYGKIKSSLIKPAVTMVMLIGAAVFLILNVIPKIYALFQGNQNIQPPFTTESLYYIGIYIQKYNIFMLVGIVGIVIGFYILSKNEKFGKFIYYIPILKKLKKLEFQAQFLMTFYLFVKTGNTVVNIFKIMEENEGNSFIKSVYKKIKVKLSKGTELSKVFKDYDFLFDEIISYMFFKAEKAGTLEETTIKLYQSYRSKIISFLEKFPEIINISTLLVGGAILLYIFLGILQPVIVFIQHASQ